MSAERRFVVKGQLGEGEVSLLVLATDEQDAQERAQGVGITGITVSGANRALARAQGFYGPNRHRPRRMAVPKGLA